MNLNNFIIPHQIKMQKFFLSGKAKNETELKSQTTKPHFAKPRGAPKRAERNEFPPQNAVGGRFGRPRKFQEKRKKFDTGAYILLCSNSFYQKFVRKTIAPPRKSGAGAKNSFGVWGKRKFFAPSPPPEIFLANKYK